MTYLRELFCIAASHGFSIKAVHIPGKSSIFEDSISLLHKPGNLLHLESLLREWTTSHSYNPYIFYLPCDCFIVFLSGSTDPQTASIETKLDQAVARYQAATFAEGTKVTYQTKQRSYVNFCLNMGNCPVPVPSTVLCRYAGHYAGHLADKRKFSSIQQYLSTIRSLHVETDWQNPLEHNWPLNSVLMGIKRVHGNRTTHKEPITPSDLSPLKNCAELVAAFWASAYNCLLWIVSKVQYIDKFYSCIIQG